MTDVTLLIWAVIFFRILIHLVYRNAFVGNTFPGDTVISTLIIKDIINSIILVQGIRGLSGHRSCIEGN